MRTLLTTCLLFLAGSALAQGDPLEETKSQLEAAKKQLAELGEPTDPDAKARREAVAARVDVLQKLVAVRTDAVALPDVSNVEERKREVEERLEAARRRPAPSRVELEDAEAAKEYEKKLEAARQKQAERRRALDDLVRRASDSRKTLDALPEKLAAARKQEAAISGDDEQQYAKRTARLGVRWLEEQRDVLQAVVQAGQVLEPVLTLELELAKLERDFAAKEMDLALAEANRLLEAQRLEEKRRAAEAGAAERIARDPIEKFRSGIRKEIADCRVETKELRQEDNELTTEAQREKKALDDLRIQQKHYETRLGYEDEDLSDLVIGAFHKFSLSADRLEQIKLPELREKIAANERRLVGLIDRVWQLELPEVDNERLTALLESVPEEKREDARRVFATVVSGRPDGLVQALDDQRRALQEIGAKYTEIENSSVARLSMLREFQEYLEARLYLIRSERFVGPALIRDAGADVANLARSYTRPELWTRTWSRVTRDVRHAAAFGIACVLALAAVLLVLFAGRRWAREADARRAVADLFLAVAPAIALVVARRLVRDADLPAELGRPVPAFLAMLALFLLVRQVSRLLLRPGGFAERHLIRSPAAVRQLYVSLMILTGFGILVRAPGAALSKLPTTVEALPRLLHTVWEIAVALALVLVIRAKGPLLTHWTKPDGFPRRAWRVLSPVACLLVLSAVILDILGFRMGAKLMLENLSLTIIAILIAGIGYAVLVPFIGRLAARARRQLLPEEGFEAANNSAGAVQTQLTRLVSAVLMCGVAVALIEFWGRNWILLDYLREIRLVETRPGVSLTLWDVLLAIIWIVGGHFVISNLTALFDFLVFPLMSKTDRGGRYVALTLSRYAIILVAYSAALLTLGFDFSSLTWLFAAASVGIGFGLQEIIANFISGIILLLERPIRVGDIVTVGTMEGTVDKITIRATVVTNWDRQSIVIPNKNFITQNVTNWSKNDDVMRRKVHVNVPLDADLQRVFRILDETVAAHPKVLKDPPHRIWFSGFGDSTIQVEVWLYTVIDFGLTTRTEMYRSIVDRFREEGIEIAVPRSEVQLSSEPESAGRGLDREGASREDRGEGGEGTTE